LTFTVKDCRLFDTREWRFLLTNFHTES